MMAQNEFDNEIKYKLYRNVRELLYPSISKKNISDYKVIVDQDILPVRVFYPKKISNLNKAIIFVHGDSKVTGCNGEYENICKKISINTNHLLIAIDYKLDSSRKKKVREDISNTIIYLKRELERNNIINSNITLMLESTAALIIKKEYEEKFPIRTVLFYPVFNIDYNNLDNYPSTQSNYEFQDFLIDNIKSHCMKYLYKKEIINKIVDVYIPKNTMIFVGNIDPLKDIILDLKKYNNVYIKVVPFAMHGFLKQNDEELEDDVFSELNKFLEV